MGPRPQTFGPSGGGVYHDMLNADWLSLATSQVPVKMTCVGSDGKAHELTFSLRDQLKDNTALTPYDIDSDHQQTQFLLYHLIQELLNRRGQPIALAPALYTTSEFVYAVKSLVDVNDYKQIPKP